MRKFRFSCLWAFLILALAGPFPAAAATIGAGVQSALQSLPFGGTVPVIATLTDQGSDLIQAAGASGQRRGTDRLALLRRLKAQAQSQQAPLRDYLQQQGVTDIQSLWLVNALAFQATPAQISEIAAMPEVASITLNGTAHVPQPPSVAYPDASPQATTAVSVPWNVSTVNAPAMWNLGYSGQGVVIAVLDSGVDADISDLAGKWRGQPGGWFDPYGNTTQPYDYSDPNEISGFGHGTAVTGVLLGGNDIGIAPGAKWIAAKIFKDDGTSTDADIHAAFQWLLDPDSNPNTDDAPDIVNGSWAFPVPGVCFNGTQENGAHNFEPDVQKLKALGIAVVFAAGNYGPDSSTSVSPANYAESFSVGSTDENNLIADFSSRGPSACTGGIYPQVVAPGTNIKTYALGGSYLLADGTSFSAPELSGVLALLKSAFPGRSTAGLETAVEQSATPLADPSPDNNYGYGLVNAKAAYEALVASDQAPATATLIAPADGTTDVTTPVTVQWQHPTDPDGDTVTDSVVISTSADFSSSQTLSATTASLKNDGIVMASGGSLLLGALFAGLGRRRRKLLAVILVLGGSLILFSCGGGGGGSSSVSSTVSVTQDSLTLNNLNPATTYYWKVVSTDGYKTSESQVWQFTTQ